MLSKDNVIDPTSTKQRSTVVIVDYHGTLITRCALQLSPLVFLRPGELRAARWADIDFDTGRPLVADRHMYICNYYS